MNRTVGEDLGAKKQEQCSQIAPPPPPYSRHLLFFLPCALLPRLKHCAVAQPPPPLPHPVLAALYLIDHLIALKRVHLIFSQINFLPSAK